MLNEPLIILKELPLVVVLGDLVGLLLICLGFGGKVGRGRWVRGHGGLLLLLLADSLLHSWFLIATASRSPSLRVVVIRVHLVEQLLVLGRGVSTEVLLASGWVGAATEILVLNELLLLALQLFFDGGLRIHVLYLPLALEELLSLPVTVKLAMLLAGKEVALPHDLAIVRTHVLRG